MKYYVDGVGRYLGGWDESPPAGSYEVPVAPDDARQLWADGQWQPVGWPFLVDQVLAAKLDALSSKRWEVEIGGIDVSGVPVRTDANSQAKITAAYTMARLDPTYSVSTWEAAPGIFVPLTNSELISIGEAVRNHIQHTFDRKAALYAQIVALDTIEELNAFDVNAAWKDE